MSLLKTISGIRGTIGGKAGDNLTSQDIVECTAGFGSWILSTGHKPLVVVGRDGRISGELVSTLAVQTLLSLGIDVIDLGLSTTPTVEMYVPFIGAGAGIIFTASHNPKEWNALKFLNHKGEFISAEDGNIVLENIANGNINYAHVNNLGKYSMANDAAAYHIDQIVKYRHVDLESIKSKKPKVVVDCINSTGAILIPMLLDVLGCEYKLINDEISGDFAHNPEPLPSHLQELSDYVREGNFDMGISVDPDVDRLAFVCEDGSMFGEEYTLVAVADYLLSQCHGGNTVSNLSSTRALSDVTAKYNGRYEAAAVGEVNVVSLMKEINAVIGGEGNGGIIVPDLHYGRDALIGIALFLTAYSKRNDNLSQWRDSFPKYTIIKDKISVAGIDDNDLKAMFTQLRKAFASEKINEVDGMKIDFHEGWVHMRKSNTEPIIRIYAEAKDEKTAMDLVIAIKDVLKI